MISTPSALVDDCRRRRGGARAALLNDGAARHLIGGERLHAPHLIDSEIASGLRRHVQRDRMSATARMACPTNVAPPGRDALSRLRPVRAHLGSPGKLLGLRRQLRRPGRNPRVRTSHSRRTANPRRPSPMHDHRRSRIALLSSRKTKQYNGSELHRLGRTVWTGRRSGATGWWSCWAAVAWARCGEPTTPRPTGSWQ